MNRLGLNHSNQRKSLYTHSMRALNKHKRPLLTRYIARWRWLRITAKLLVAANLALAGTAGCSDIQIEKAAVESAVHIAMQIGFDRGDSYSRLKYHVASTLCDLLEYSVEKSIDGDR